MKIFNITILTLILFVLASCSDSKGTSTGNPLVNLRYAAFSSRMSVQAISEAKLCFKRLRFKKLGETTNPDTDADEDNIDFNIGEKTLVSTGDNLGDIRVPPGQYTRIEIDLDDACPNNFSVSVINGIGSFVTSDRISIKFDGTITITESTSLELQIQNIITELNAVTNSGQIKSRLESVSGAF